MRTRQTHYQYEPLITPAEWQGEEKRFAIRLAAHLDNVFQRLGRMEKELAALKNAQKGENANG